MKHAKPDSRTLSPLKSWAGTSWTAVAGICLVVAGVTAGCQSIENERAVNTEALLQQAGFQVRFADSAERLDHVKALEQRSFVKKDRDGQPYYVYADAAGCKCLYYGTQAEYQKYRVLENDQEVAANDRLNDVINNANAQMYYSLWQGENGMPNTPPPPGVLPGV